MCIRIILCATRDFSHRPLFSSALLWSAAEGYFFLRGSMYEAFLAALNGTMAAAYRADSCFIELVYNVRWMEHINRFKLTSFPPCPPPPPPTTQKRERSKIRKSEQEKTENPPLTPRYNECLFHRCHLSTTACFVTYKRGEECRRGEAGVECDRDFQGSQVIKNHKYGCKMIRF